MMRTICITVILFVSWINTSVGQELKLILVSSSKTFVVGEKIHCKLVIENFNIDSTVKTQGFDFLSHKDLGYEFEIVAQKKGPLTLGPYRIDFNGKKLVSDSIVLTIVKRPTDENKITLQCPDKASVNEKIEIQLISTKTPLDDIKFKKDKSIIIGKTSSSSSTSSRMNEETEYLYTMKIELTFTEKGSYKINDDWFDNVPDKYEVESCKIKVE